MSGRTFRTRAWAEEVEEEEQEACSPIYDESSKQYRTSDSKWHEGLDVERGMSKQRLDTRHGFYKSIVGPDLHLNSPLMKTVWEYRNAGILETAY